MNDIAPSSQAAPAADLPRPEAAVRTRGATYASIRPLFDGGDTLFDDGIALANTVYFPIAESIHSKTQKELLIQMLITDGVQMTQGEQSPKRLAIKLEALLTRSARSNEHRSLKGIREILQHRRTQTEAPQVYG